MKICIPVRDDLGPDSHIHDHFGSAPYFANADTDTGLVHVTENRGHEHAHGQCKPVDHIDPEAIDAVVCRGMGKRALASLASGSVKVLITRADTVREVLAEARNDALEPLTMEAACGGHGHGHGH